ncbi:hypothetical protein [Kutzneria sp. NPDC051319]
MPDRRADAAWSAWILDLADQAGNADMNKTARATGKRRVDDD